MRQKELARKRRHIRIRSRMAGTESRPRVIVFRSLRATYAQAVNDDSGVVIAQASDLKHVSGGTRTERAKTIGKELGALLSKNNITHVAFDRGGYLYHGRVKAVADGMREAGLQL